MFAKKLPGFEPSCFGALGFSAAGVFTPLNAFSACKNELWDSSSSNYPSRRLSDLLGGFVSSTNATCFFLGCSF
jgi:hypothetical protein